jgi:hypothetical protein
VKVILEYPMRVLSRNRVSIFVKCDWLYLREAYKTTLQDGARDINSVNCSSEGISVLSLSMVLQR